MQPNNTLQRPVVLFDGVCNLCSSVVKFIIKHDKENLFVFASLQSAFGQDILNRFQLAPTTFNSFILFEDNKIYTKSTGALRVARLLTGWWSLLYYLIIIPRLIRDAVYNYVATNRYKWFGKKEECWIPTPELSKKFID